MNLKEAFAQVIQVGMVDGQTLDMALTAAGLDAGATFTPEHLPLLEVAAIPVLQSLLAIGSQSEGGYSISLNPEGIRQRLLLLAAKHQVAGVLAQLNLGPVIQSRNVW